MTVISFIEVFQWVFLAYFVILNGVYLILNVVALVSIRRQAAASIVTNDPGLTQRLYIPISIIVPAYNESGTISEVIRSLLQIEYPEFEILVINDGSRDDTLAVMQKDFSLRLFPEAYRVRLQSQPVRAVYRSTVYPNLRVIDKLNGGKADSTNVGINAARYPVFGVIDADSVLQRDSLRLAIRPFLDDPTTVAAGGTIRILNGCRVQGGFVESVDLPRHPLATFQVVEYLRAFLLGRMGWSPMNALLIISGAFGLFRKETVVAAGGFRADTIGEDMELVVRMHRLLRAQKRPYRIAYVPEPICWTEAPEDLGTLARQRIRWQRGLIESLKLNLSLLFNVRAGSVGMLAFPFFLLIECLGPVFEVLGFLLLLVAALIGVLSVESFLLVTALSVALGVLLSTSSFLFEQMSFRIYPRLGQTLKLFFYAVIENFGYRQLNSIWRMYGTWLHLRRIPAVWGEMKRVGSWGGDRPTAGKAPASAPATGSKSPLRSP